MVTATILITGGFVVAGTRILLRRKRTRTPVWLVQRDGTRVKTYATIVESEEVTENAREREINTSYALSTVSLALNLTGELLFRPVMWFSMPIDMYNLAMIIDPGTDQLYRSRWSVHIVAVGIFITIYILSNQFVIISCIQLGYSLYRKATFEVQKQLGAMASAASPAST